MKELKGSKNVEDINKESLFRLATKFTQLDSVKKEFVAGYIAGVNDEHERVKKEKEIEKENVEKK